MPRSLDRLSRRTTRIFATLPEALVQQMDAIIGNPRTRYHTRSEMVGDALLGLCEKEARQQHAGMLDITVALRNWQNNIQYEENMNLFRENLLHTINRVTEYRNVGWFAEADDLIQRTVAQVNSMPSGLWSRRFTMDMHEAFGYVEMKNRGLNLLEDVVDVPTPGEDVDWELEEEQARRHGRRGRG